jgi:hypothetical protein
MKLGDYTDLSWNELIKRIGTWFDQPNILKEAISRLSSAKNIKLDTTNFDNNLSSTDTDVQKAFETLDDLISSGGGATNLSTTQTSTAVTINSNNGTDAIIPLGNGTNAGVSINDYTTAEKNKLSGISTGATINDSDANLKNRANHTGTQTASTISDFDTEVSNNTSVAAATSHIANTLNPHSVTKTQVGLGNVDNTSDANKPISTATQTALDTKQATLVSATNIKTVNGASILGSGDLTVVGVGALVEGDIDTLAKINAIITDATLIDTTDSRLSDARTPTAHNHAISTEITGLGTGVATALGVNIGSAGAPVIFGGALGTPISGNLANMTFPTLNQSTTGSAATLTTPRTIWGQGFDGSANVIGDLALGSSSLTSTGSIATTGSRILKGWFTDLEITNAPTIGGATATGTGGIVRAVSPTLTTPTLGVATATSINGATITSGTLNGSVTGVNTGDQTSIVGITATKAEYNTSCTDGEFLFVGDVTQSNPLLRVVTYGASITDTYDPTEPNFFIPLAGNITLAIGSITAGGGGIVNLNRASGTETITLTGILAGNHTYPTGASDVIRLTYSYEQGNVVWYCLNPIITASLVTDFDTEVANNTAVTANTAKTGVTTQISNVVEDTTPEFGGDINYNSNGLKLIGQTVGGSNGNAVYLSGSNTWSATDASAEATSKSAIGIRISSTEVLTHGVYTTSGLTAGATYFLSETTGAITATAPTTSASIVRVIGYALTTTELFVNTDQSYFENA